MAPLGNQVFIEYSFYSNVISYMLSVMLHLKELVKSLPVEFNWVNGPEIENLTNAIWFPMKHSSISRMLSLNIFLDFGVRQNPINKVTVWIASSSSGIICTFFSQRRNIVNSANGRLQRAGATPYNSGCVLRWLDMFAINTFRTPTIWPPAPTIWTHLISICEVI